MTRPGIALAAAFVAASSLAAPAAATPGEPPAAARCMFQTIETIEPDRFDGAVYGVAVAPGSAVSVRCTLTVSRLDGTPVSATPAESVTTPSAAALAAPLTFRATWEEHVVRMCTAVTVDGTTWYTNGGAWSTDPATRCPDPQVVRVPPDPCGHDIIGGCLGPVLDLLEGPLDAASCPVIATLPSYPGVVEVRDGDLYVAGELFWDCRPYAS